MRRAAPLLWRWALALVVSTVAGWQLSPWLLDTPEALAIAGHIKDDGFFYSVLVDNRARYGAWTFDGVMSTNGFQPLWLVVVWAARALVPDTLDTLTLLCRLSWGSYLLFCAAAVLLVTRPAAPGRQGAWWTALIRVVFVAGLVLLNRPFQDAVVEGLEVPLVLALLCAGLLVAAGVVERAAQAPDRAWRGGVLLGAVGAVVFFGRTDLLWLTPALGAWLWLRTGRRWVPLVATGATAAALVAPYLVWNLLDQGSVMPISGRVKLHVMREFLPTLEAWLDSEEWRGMVVLFGDTWLRGLDLWVRAGATLALFLGAQAVAWSPWGRRELGGEARALAAVTFVHVLYMHLLYGELRPYTHYYFAPELLCVTWLLASWVAAAPWRPAAVALAAYVLVTSSASWGPMDLTASGEWRDRVKLAQRLPELVRDGDRVGAFWPGTFAAFSGLPVTPLDGVIGSNTYFEEAIKGGHEVEWALDHGVNLIISYGSPKQLLGRKPPRPQWWSFVSQRRIWDQRARLKARHHEGKWTLLEAVETRGSRP